MDPCDLLFVVVEELLATISSIRSMTTRKFFFTSAHFDFYIIYVVCTCGTEFCPGRISTAIRSILLIFKLSVQFFFSAKENQRCVTPQKDHAYSAQARVRTTRDLNSKAGKKLAFESAKEHSPASTNDHSYAKSDEQRREDLLKLVSCESSSKMQLLPPQTRTHISHIKTVQELAGFCMGDNIIKSALQASFIEEMQSSIGGMSALKHGPMVSVLSKLDYEDLTQFSWLEVLEELATKQPALAKVLFGCMLHNNSKTAFLERSPKIGMIYSIIMQSRFHYLSRVQRIVAHCLQESTCERKVITFLKFLKFLIYFKFVLLSVA